MISRFWFLQTLNTFRVWRRVRQFNKKYPQHPMNTRELLTWADHAFTDWSKHQARAEAARRAAQTQKEQED